MKKISILLLILLIVTTTPNWHSFANDKNEMNMDYLVKYGEVKYIVPTLKLTFDALPFTVKVPTYYPFKEIHDSFITSGINYYKDEDKIETDLRLDNRNNSSERIEIIVSNFPHKDYEINKNINIQSQTKGYFEEALNYSTLYFIDKQDIYYRVDYVNKEKSHQERVQELKKIFASFTDYTNVFNYNN
ncbi:hypothetical protein ACLIA0_07165 [Bacillaceae bacterium W0354]